MEWSLVLWDGAASRTIVASVWRSRFWNWMKNESSFKEERETKKTHSLNERFPAHLPFPTTFLNVTNIIWMILQLKKIILIALFLFINPIRVVVCRGHIGSIPINRPMMMIPMPIIDNLRRSHREPLLTRSLLSRRRRLRARFPRLCTIHTRGRLPSRRLPPQQTILLPRRRREWDRLMARAGLEARRIVYPSHAVGMPDCPGVISCGRERGR